MDAMTEDPAKMTRAEALAEIQTLKNQQWDTLEKLTRKQITDTAATKISKKIAKRLTELKAMLAHMTD